MQSQVTRICRVVLIVAVVMTTSTGVRAQGLSHSNDPPRASAHASANTGSAVQGSGWRVPVVLLRENFSVLIPAPGEHLLRARAAIAAGANTDAADQVRAAAVFLDMEARTAQGEQRTELVEATKDLQKLATRVATGDVHSADALDKTLRKTDHALARHHLDRANAAWRRREVSAAGRELRGAADYTERLAHDVGKDVEKGTTDTVHATRELSGKLIDGVGWSVDEVGKGFATLGHALDRLGAGVEPKRSSARASGGGAG